VPAAAPELSEGRVDDTMYVRRIDDAGIDPMRTRIRRDRAVGGRTADLGLHDAIRKRWEIAQQLDGAGRRAPSVA
jgi:hypothetical protein